jgi:hypothetical protein
MKSLESRASRRIDASVLAVRNPWQFLRDEFQVILLHSKERDLRPKPDLRSRRKFAYKKLSVPGHAFPCGPETSVTIPLRWRWFPLRGYEKTYIHSSRPGAVLSDMADRLRTRLKPMQAKLRSVSGIA